MKRSRRSPARWRTNLWGTGCSREGLKAHAPLLAVPLENVHPVATRAHSSPVLPVDGELRNTGRPCDTIAEQPHLFDLAEATIASAHPLSNHPSAEPIEPRRVDAYKKLEPADRGRDQVAPPLDGQEGGRAHGKLWFGRLHGVTGPRSYFDRKFIRLSGDNTGYGTAWNCSRSRDRDQTRDSDRDLEPEL